MRLLVFGSSGQIGSEVAGLAAARGMEVIAPGASDADLTDPTTCAELIRSAGAGTVINAAAYTDVDGAETEEDLAWTVNADAPAAMARAAAAVGSAFLHLSTDYVFDGSGDQPWRADDTPGPLGTYARTKLGGEQGVLIAGDCACVLRTSWVFSPRGRNFVKSMLRLSEERSRIRVVADQIGGPTPAHCVARALLSMARSAANGRFRSGVFHYAGTPNTSWAGFAREIFRQAGRNVTVTDITSEDYPMSARRPKNCRLDCSSVQDSYGLERPDWRRGLGEVLKDLRRNGSTR